jgi:hypothetical protein
MKLTDVDKYLALREALSKEKAALEKRLAAINRALEGNPASSASAASRGLQAGAGSRGKRPKNELSMKEATVKALSDKPLTRSELLEAVLKVGYKFSGKNPLNSLSTLLYSDKTFKNHDGKFSVSK